MTDNNLTPPDDDDAPKIGDAGALFRESPSPRPAPQVPERTHADAGGLYELVDRPEPELPPAPATASHAPVDRPADGSSKAKATPADEPARASRTGLEPSSAVEEVWSRGAEWGSTFVKLVGAGLGLFVVLYLLVANEVYGIAFLVLLGGGLGLTLLSYPILITLERPVRITPEQAVRDFYSALSHHVPHYRRMWLLLSSAGRVSGSYASFEGFCAYWNRRLKDLRSGRASSFTPLKFQVEDFKSPKSAGMNEVEAGFTVTVFVRGRQQEGPVETHRVKTTLVKGPDRMWYLDTGTLP